MCTAGAGACVAPHRAAVLPPASLQAKPPTEPGATAYDEHMLMDDNRFISDIM